MTVLMLLVLSLADLSLFRRQQGVDLVVLADLSDSMPVESKDRILELIKHAEAQRRGMHRVAVVTFGKGVQIERNTSAGTEFGGFQRPVDGSASDLAGGLKMALGLLQSAGSGKIIILSDGKYTNLNPIPLAQEAALRNVTIDYRAFERPTANDLSVESFDLPGEVIQGEPYQFSAVINSDQEREAEVVLYRGDKKLSSRTRKLRRGKNRILFRDLLHKGGLQNYRLELIADGDPVLQNNSARAVVRTLAPPKVLLVNQTGQPDNLYRALKQYNYQVELAGENQNVFSAAKLDGCGVVILENVPADAIGYNGMAVLKQYVEKMGGGLLLTGGKRSFGVGGYHNSVLDPVLPVTMEIREEQRKFQVAIAVALDRSGSMSMPVSGGRTKMDLANLGTAAVIEMLSPMDEISVIAVDSRAHIIVPMQKIGKKSESIQSKTKKIQSMGGGIFTYTALLAAMDQVRRSATNSRHVVIFADAADAEEPGNYKGLLKKANAIGVTVSVIGLGTKSDCDAKFLMDVAKRGNGRCFFTVNPKELPRLFTQDTMSVVRSSFIEEATNGSWLSANLSLLGESYSGSFPTVGGYNLCYLQKDASMGAVTVDEYNAPIFAYWFHGLGRAAAMTVEVDGKFTGQFASWQKYPSFFDTLTRWLLGEQTPEGMSVQIEPHGTDVLVRLELDPQKIRELQVDQAKLRIVKSGLESSVSAAIQMTWEDDHTLVGHFQADQSGNYLPLVDIGKRRFIKAAPFILPYSPEFVSWEGELSPKEVLSRLSYLTGGQERYSMVDIFAGVQTAKSFHSLAVLLGCLAMLLFVGEVLYRRLDLWEFGFGLQHLKKPFAKLRLLAKRKTRPVKAKPASPLLTGDKISGIDEKVEGITIAPEAGKEATKESPATDEDKPSAFKRAKERIKKKYKY
ncbi:VWA domain-containing protein, partial [Planctomycetota bacterium]